MRTKFQGLSKKHCNFGFDHFPNPNPPPTRFDDLHTSKLSSTLHSMRHVHRQIYSTFNNNIILCIYICMIHVVM